MGISVVFASTSTCPKITGGVVKHGQQVRARTVGHARPTHSLAVDDHAPGARRVLRCKALASLRTLRDRGLSRPDLSACTDADGRSRKVM